MPGHEEDAAILADAYIDALLGRPRPLAVAAGSHLADATRTKRAAVLLSALPRYHPSFAFEESLAARLRELAEGTAATGGRLAEVIPFPGTRQPGPHMPSIDRRLLVGGAAIASGVSVAAVIAWWQVGRRQRHEVLA